MHLDDQDEIIDLTTRREEQTMRITWVVEWAGPWIRKRREFLSKAEADMFAKQIGIGPDPIVVCEERLAR